MTTQQQLRAYVDYLRDMGVYDLYRRDDPAVMLPEALRAEIAAGAQSQAAPAAGKGVAAARAALRPSEPVQRPAGAPAAGKGVAAARAALRPSEPVQRPAGAPAAAFWPTAPVARPAAGGVPPRAAAEPLPLPPELVAPMPKPKSFDELMPPPVDRVPPGERAAALVALREEIGDCTRCPLAYAGRRKIVFADGDPVARLMFVGEGPGADEDESGIPFVGKAGQLLNNMISAMGLKREEVYIANIVKCRPPANRTPEYVEATTCSQFLLRQIDIVQPELIVALGATAATYLLGVKQSLASLRGTWHTARGAKVAVTYHPAFLLRDPRQKGEAWKDLQRVMAEMGLKPPAKAGA